jgi:hypothetical protein
LARASHGARSANEVQDECDQRYHQQDVNHCAGYVKDTPTKNPRDQENNEENCEDTHRASNVMSRISRGKPYDEPLGGNRCILRRTYRMTPIQIAPEYLLPSGARTGNRKPCNS